jgi:hypothetical protein
MWESDEETNDDPVTPPEEESIAYIQGQKEVYPFDVITYTLIGANAAGAWSINNNKAKIVKSQDNTVEV